MTLQLVFESENDHVANLFEEIIEPHFLLFDVPTKKPNTWLPYKVNTWNDLAKRWVFQMWDYE